LEPPEHKPERVLWWRYVEYPIAEPYTAEELEELRAAKRDKKEAEKDKDGTEPMDGADEAVIADDDDEIPLRPLTKMAPRREREFFVKWKYLSYWHCSWVSEMYMDVHFHQSLVMYWRKMDPEVPPEVG
jgi:hypothetical protein